MVKKARVNTAARQGRASTRGRDAASRGAARRGSSLTRKVRDRNVVMLPAHRYHLEGGQQQMAPVVPLPVLRAGGELVPAGMAPVSQRGEIIGQVVSGSSRWLWRHRWPLAPFVAAAGVAVGAAGDAAMCTVAAAALAAAGHAAAKKLPDRIGGRVWLSLRERVLAGNWALGAAAWSTSVGFGWFDVDLGGLALLGAATGVQTKDWINSRRIRRENDTVTGAAMSSKAAALIASWPYNIGINGPDALRGSRIVAESMTEPAADVYSFAVELREGVHGETAVTDDTRRYLERALRMGVGTAEVRIDRDDAALVQITFTPARNLEVAAAEWLGPVLNEDGTIPLAVNRDGSDALADLHDEAGVRHLLVVGTSGGGKSNSVVSMVLPGAYASVETVWYIDGGEGTSATHQAGAVDWWAGRDVAQWEPLIRAAHAVMRARKQRRAELGRSSWRGRQEKDPILTVIIDEATTVKGQISSDVEQMVLDMLREGRKLGVRIGQSTPDPMGDDLIGGRKARGLMGGAGTVIGHRPGDGTANTLTGSSSAESIDLRALPPEPGWCGILRRGHVETKAARVRYAEPEKVEALLRGFTPRALAGGDLTAAGDAYARRTTGTAEAARIADARRREADGLDPAATTMEDTTMRTDQTGQGTGNVVELESARDKALTGSQLAAKRAAEARRQAILLTLQTFPIGCTRAQLLELTEMPKATFERHLRALKDEGRVVQVDADGRSVLRLVVDTEQAG